MSNTQKRILSAIIMVFIVVVTLLSGEVATKILLLSIGFLCIDEISVNLFKFQRFSFNYLVSEILFLSSFIFCSFFLNDTKDLAVTFGILGLNLNIIFILMLFFLKKETKLSFLKKGSEPFFISFMILVPLVTVSLVVGDKNWKLFLIQLLLINFSADTGAWFFGKNFGKNKLWPSVSPKKTVEGLFGGIFTAMLIGGFFWNYTHGSISITVLALIGVSALTAQFGDLFQSKLKRQAEIKDSSSLIPGHGGVYDRIDSVLFLIPFFVVGNYYLNN